MNVTSKQAVLESLKRHFAQDFVVGNAESHPQEFAHYVAVKQAAGQWWGINSDELLSQN